MSGGVFVLKDPNTLVAMKPAHFAKEEDFQRLLAQFPALLGAIHGDSDAPRRWLLLSRETGIPSENGGSDRFAVDHLFLDQDGIPTLVEVKRAGDTRLRREVVGQILDYAANAILHWSWERLRDQFENAYAADVNGAATTLADFAGADGAGVFWETVKTNLQAGKIRLLIVADVIPPEVKGIVEFLNKQMDPAEILAVELRQYEGEGLRTIVPTIFGQTEEARKSVNGPKRQWDEASIFEELSHHVVPELLPVARRVADWIKTKSDEVVFGRGNRDGSIGAGFRRKDSRLLAIQLWTSGVVTLNFGYMSKPPFDDNELCKGWIDSLRAVPGLILPQDAENRYPNIGLTILSAHIDLFIDAMDWLAQSLRVSPNGPVSNTPITALPHSAAIEATHLPKMSQ